MIYKMFKLIPQFDSYPKEITNTEQLSKIALYQGSLFPWIDHIFDG